MQRWIESTQTRICFERAPTQGAIKLPYGFSTQTSLGLLKQGHMRIEVIENTDVKRRSDGPYVSSV